jgi:hypothetical protein
MANHYHGGRRQWEETAPVRTRKAAPSGLLAYLDYMNAQSSIVSEFATAEDQAAYQKWLAGKVAASLADDSPPVAHDDAMTQARAIIEQNKRRRRKGIALSSCLA